MLALAPVGVAPNEIEARVLRPERAGFGLVGNGAGVVAFQLVGDAAAVKGPRVFRVERDNLGEIGDRPVVVALRQKGLSAVVVGPGCPRIVPNDLAAASDRQVLTADLLAVLPATCLYRRCVDRKCQTRSDDVSTHLAPLRFSVRRI